MLKIYSTVSILKTENIINYWLNYFILLLIVPYFFNAVLLLNCSASNFGILY